LPYTILIDLKNNGSLIYASHDVYKIVCAIKTEFFIGTNNNKLPKEDAILKIIYRVARRYRIKDKNKEWRYHIAYN